MFEDILNWLWGISPILTVAIIVLCIMVFLIIRYLMKKGGERNNQGIGNIKANKSNIKINQNQ